MWSARQTWKMGRRAAGFHGGLLATILLVAAPAAAAFVEPINLSNSPALSGRPAIAVNERNGTPSVFAVWEEGGNIVFASSRPGLASCGGLEFGEGRIILSSVLGSAPARQPAVAANDSGGIFVVWQVSAGVRDPAEVWFSRSTNNGESFESPVNLSSNPLIPSDSPSVAANNLGDVFVAWSDGSPGQIVFRRSLGNSGGTFEPALGVSPPPGEIASRAASVAAGGNNVFLAWEQRSGNGQVSEIRYKMFGRGDVPANVANPATTKTLSTGVLGASSPHLAFGGRGLSVTFATLTSVYYRSSGDGINFIPALTAPPENLSVAGSFPSRARGARRNDSVNDSAVVAWEQKPSLTSNSTPDIRHRLIGSTNGAEPVLTTAARRASPAAAIDSTGRLLVAWQGREAADLLNDEVYLSYSGGTGSGSPMNATVWTKPQVLDLRHLARGRAQERSSEGPGSGRVTVFIELPGGLASEIDLTTVKLNGQPVLFTPGEPDEDGDHDAAKLGDKNKNGVPDLKVKFSRSAFAASAGQADAQGYLSYSVTGQTTSGRCFARTATVQIRR